MRAPGTLLPLYRHREPELSRLSLTLRERASMTVEIRLEIKGHPPREYQLDRPEFVIGCHPFNEVVVEHLSARHGRFSLKDGRLRYEDLGSRRGSRRVREDNAKRLRACGCELNPGDRLLLGAGVELTVIGFDSTPKEPALLQIQLTAKTPTALLDLLPESARASVIDATHSLPLAKNITGASALLQTLVGLLCPSANIFLVIPQGAADFQDRVLHCSACPLGDASPPPDDVLQSPEPEMLREHLTQHHILIARPSGGSAIDLLAPIGCEKSLTAYLRVQLLATPGEAVLRQLAALLRFLQPPLLALVRLDEQERRLAQLAEENRYFRTRSRRHYFFKSLVYESESMAALQAQINAKRTQADPVLILGEAGSGKQLIARALHHLGERADGMFITQNCGKLNQDALDLELFGSGGVDDHARIGLCEVADGGTLFLDEVDRLSLPLQAKLIRMINEQEIRRLGERAARPVAVRLIASTHRDIHALVATGLFRRDLFSILWRSPLHVPPLLERTSDILPLAQHFLETFNKRYGLSVEGFDEDASAHLIGYSWPGNVRELQVVMETAVMKARQGNVKMLHLDLNDSGHDEENAR